RQAVRGSAPGPPGGLRRVWRGRRTGRAGIWRTHPADRVRGADRRADLGLPALDVRLLRTAGPSGGGAAARNGPARLPHGGDPSEQPRLLASWRGDGAAWLLDLPGHRQLPAPE